MKLELTERIGENSTRNYVMLLVIRSSSGLQLNKDFVL